MVISISTHFLYTTFGSKLTGEVTLCVFVCAYPRAIPSCYPCRAKRIVRGILRYVTVVSVIYRWDILSTSWLFPSTPCAFLHVQTTCLADSLWKRDQTLHHNKKIRRKLWTSCLPAFKGCRVSSANYVQNIIKEGLLVANRRQGWYSILGLLRVKSDNATNEYNQYFSRKLLNDFLFHASEGGSCELPHHDTRAY